MTSQTTRGSFVSDYLNTTTIGPRKDKMTWEWKLVGRMTVTYCGSASDIAGSGLKAYPSNPAARKAISPQAKWRKAR